MGGLKVSPGGVEKEGAERVRFTGSLERCPRHGLLCFLVIGLRQSPGPSEADILSYLLLPLSLHGLKWNGFWLVL